MALMSIPRITGQHARELLDGTTRGPWTVDKPHQWEEEAADGLFIYGHPEDGTTAYPEIVRGHFEDDADLIAAAPALAETVAWLHGREPDSVGGWTDLRYELGDGFRVDVNGPTISVGTRRLAMKFSRDEAMGLVRAVLSAVERLPDAEEARNVPPTDRLEALDPVESRARELHDAAWPNVGARDRDRDVWETCLRLARHQLGQEARDE